MFTSLKIARDEVASIFCLKVMSPEDRLRMLLQGFTMMSHTMKSTAEEEENALGDDVHVAALPVERYHVEATSERADATMETRRNILEQDEKNNQRR